ncbi:MAG TPA: CDC27 family protein [Rhizomicrobium sp.]|jgi:hypothetical protein
MTKKFVGAAVGAWLLGGVAAVALMTVPAFAADAAKTEVPKGTAAVGKALQAAVTAIQAKDYATAQTQLAAAKAAPNPNDADQVQIDKVTAYLDLNTNDMAGALAAYKRIIASPLFTQMLTPDEQAQTLKNTMILANQAKDYTTAAQVGEKLAASGTMDDKAASSLAQTYYMNKDYAKAQALAQKSADAAIAAGGKPDKATLQILMNIDTDKKDQADARKILDQLLLYYPDPHYWAEGVDITLGTTPGLKDMQLLQLYRLRILSGAEGDLIDYSAPAELAMKNGYPGEARSMLQTAASRGISGTGPKLAPVQAKAAADEKTLAANDASAAKAADGKLDLIVAEQYYGYGRYAEAETAAKRAVSKGGTKDPEEAKMVLGIAQAAQGKYADAQQTFQQVGGSDAQKKIAHLWIIYAQSKTSPAATPAPATTPSPAPAH